MQVYSDPSRESDPHALPDVETHYYVYRLNPDNVWVRITSSGPTSYNDAKAIERSYKSDGYIVRLFSASHPNTVVYAPDVH